MDRTAGEAAGEIKAAPPGEPDPVDLSRLAGFETPDPIVLLNRQRIRQGYLGAGLAIWSYLVLMTLVSFIFTGSLFFLAIGYLVTVPFLATCYHYREVGDRVDEYALYCRMDGC